MATSHTVTGGVRWLGRGCWRLGRSLGFVLMTNLHGVVAGLLLFGFIGHVICHATTGPSDDAAPFCCYALATALAIPGLAIVAALVMSIIHGWKWE